MLGLLDYLFLFFNHCKCDDNVGISFAKFESYVLYDIKFLSLSNQSSASSS